jgi:hypothetical protein
VNAEAGSVITSAAHAHHILSNGFGARGRILLSSGGARYQHREKQQCTAARTATAGSKRSAVSHGSETEWPMEIALEPRGRRRSRPRTRTKKRPRRAGAPSRRDGWGGGQLWCRERLRCRRTR